GHGAPFPAVSGDIDVWKATSVASGPFPRPAGRSAWGQENIGDGTVLVSRRYGGVEGVPPDRLFVDLRPGLILDDATPRRILSGPPIFRAGRLAPRRVGLDFAARGATMGPERKRRGRAS